MASDAGSSAGDPTLRRRIEPWDFEAIFDPRELRKEACLLYEIKWGTCHKIWRHSGKNTTRHVEVNFIEKITSERQFCSSTSCSIIWFLSWSPCWECSKAITEFLRQRPGVTLVIYVARLYHHMDEQNRQGLRDLIKSGVTLQIMTTPEYDYCWRNFVNYPPGKDTHCPIYPPLWMKLYALELHCIILSLPPCLMISRRCQKQLTWYRLNLQNCHYQQIPHHELQNNFVEFLNIYQNFQNVINETLYARQERLRTAASGGSKLWTLILVFNVIIILSLCLESIP